MYLFVYEINDCCFRLHGSNLFPASEQLICHMEQLIIFDNNLPWLGARAGRAKMYFTAAAKCNGDFSPIKKHLKRPKVELDGHETVFMYDHC